MKKFMVAMTGLVTLFTIGATVPAVTGTATTTAHAATHVGPSLSVKAIYNNSKSITGTATKALRLRLRARRMLRRAWELQRLLRRRVSTRLS